MNPESYKLFQYGYDFTKNLIQIANNCGEGDNMMDYIKNYLMEYTFHKKFYLPVDFEKPFDGIQIEKIRTIDSKTRPIILPCIYDGDKVFNVMLKKEDIRKEEIVMKIIKLMDIFLKREENLDLNVTLYNILPISHEYGYIQFVPNSHTLYSIREEKKFTIQNFILEKNPEIDINTFRDTFSKSCALYCVVSYLLGIGDRHLDNIMITEDGKLFHIDFAYILGRDPKVVCPEIRITPEMIDAMGGHQSRHYHLFKQYCGQAYNCLRRHSAIFYTLLLSLNSFKPLLNDNIDTDIIREYIIQRFNPGENYRSADMLFKQKIELNCNTYSENIIDFFHKKYKSSKENNMIVDYAKSYITSSMNMGTSLLSNSIMKLFS
jgi:phosphatidylinositol 3-kinase